MDVKQIPIRVVGKGAKEFRDACELLGLTRVPSPHDGIAGKKDPVLLYGCPRSLYDEAVAEAHGSVDVAENVLSHAAVQVILEDAARMRAGLPTNPTTN